MNPKKELVWGLWVKPLKIRIMMNIWNILQRAELIEIVPKWLCTISHQSLAQLCKLSQQVTLKSRSERPSRSFYKEGGVVPTCRSKSLCNPPRGYAQEDMQGRLPKIWRSDGYP